MRDDAGPLESDPWAQAASLITGDLVRVDEVTKIFGAKTALNGVSFSVPQGQICGLLGPNGAGKSTTFKMLCGLLTPSAGNGSVAGIDLRKAKAVARCVRERADSGALALRGERGGHPGCFRGRTGDGLRVGPADRETSILQRGQLQPSSCKGIRLDLHSEYIKGTGLRNPGSPV